MFKGCNTLLKCMEILKVLQETVTLTTFHLSLQTDASAFLEGFLGANQTMRGPPRTVAKGMCECSVCGYVCSKMSGLRDHMRSHTGERPFECQYCVKTFKHTSHLYRHMRTLHNHTGAIIVRENSQAPATFTDT